MYFTEKDLSRVFYVKRWILLIMTDHVHLMVKD